jgi:gephyrin
MKASLEITPFAALSRPVAGTFEQMMIITLPGSPKACVENLTAIEAILPHALELIKGDSGETTHRKMTKFEDTGHRCIHRSDLEPNSSASEIRTLSTDLISCTGIF